MWWNVGVSWNIQSSATSKNNVDDASTILAWESTWGNESCCLVKWKLLVLFQLQERIHLKDTEIQIWFVIIFYFLIFSIPFMHLLSNVQLQLPFSNQRKDRHFFEKINKHCTSMQKEFLSVNIKVNKIQIKGSPNSDETFK